MVIGPLLVGAALTLQPAAAAPAPRAPRAYAYGSAFVSHHPANGAAYHRVTPNLGGRSIDVAGGAGGFLTNRIGLEGEFVFGGDVSRPQRFSYFFSEDYIGRNRDILINELLRYRASPVVQLVAGGGYARVTSRSTSIVTRDTLGRITMPPDRSATVQGLTWTAGADFLVRAAERVSVAPAIRVRWIKRPGSDGYGWNGIGDFTFQFGASLILR
jgi:hypothetical protein